MHSVARLLSRWLAPAALLLSTSAFAAEVGDLVELLEAHVPEDVILEQLRSEGRIPELDSEDWLALKQAGASDDFLRQLSRLETAGAETTVPEGEDSERSPSRRAGSYDSYYHPFLFVWYAGPTRCAYYDPFSWWSCRGYWNGCWANTWCNYGLQASSWCHPRRHWYGGGYYASSTRGRYDDRSAWGRGRGGYHRPDRASGGREVRGQTRTREGRNDGGWRKGDRSRGWGRESHRGSVVGRGPRSAPAPRAPREVRPPSPPRARESGNGAWRRR